MQLKFHSKTFALLGIEPIESPSASLALDKIESRWKVRLPPSVREWYSLQDATVLLETYSNQDHPICLGKIAAAETDWYRSDPRDPFHDELCLILMVENQGVCDWSVAVNAQEDPPVFVNIPTDKELPWRRHAQSFSEFTFTQVWDHQMFEASVASQDIPITPEVLSELRAKFSERTRTFGCQPKLIDSSEKTNVF